jgi:plasmid stabilization system protein ParE
MAQIRIARKAQADLDRLFQFLLVEDAQLARKSMQAILEAIAVLGGHPLIGRPLEGDLRELVISRGRTGYLALYRYLPRTDAVRVLAIRHQREAGYPGWR